MRAKRRENQKKTSKTKKSSKKSKQRKRKRRQKPAPKADVIVLDMSDDDDFVLKSTDNVPEDSLYRLSKNAGESLEQPKQTGDEQDQEAEVGNEGGEIVTKESLSEEPQSTVVAHVKEENEDQSIKRDDSYSPQIGEPKEDDLNGWAHHQRKDKLIDRLLAESDSDDMISFVFELQVKSFEQEEPKLIKNIAL